MQFEIGESTRGKILLVIAFYVALGIIAFFNFGIYRHFLPKGKHSMPTVSITLEEKSDEELQKTLVTDE